MNTQERLRLKNLSVEEKEIRRIVILECQEALTPYAFTSFEYSILGRLNRRTRMIKYTADETNLVKSIWNPILELGRGRVGKILVISSKLWLAICSDSAALSLVDPVTRYEDVLKGHLGVMLGMELCTDGYQDPALIFLKDLEFTLVDGLDEFYKLVPPPSEKEILELNSKSSVQRAKIFKDVFDIVLKTKAAPNSALRNPHTIVFEDFMCKVASTEACNTALEEMSQYAKQTGLNVHMELWVELPLEIPVGDRKTYKLCTHIEVAPDTDITKINKLEKET